MPDVYTTITEAAPALLERLMTGFDLRYSACAPRPYGFPLLHWLLAAPYAGHATVSGASRAAPAGYARRDCR
jgi:hypothetical protein